MRRSVKVKQTNKSAKQVGQGPKSQREANLLRENLKRRKLQARTKAQLEQTDLDESGRQVMKIDQI